jgi:4-alpha-glucanotransferase
MGTPSKRSAGILLHPTSLPGRYGIGDLGPSAYLWVDKLASAAITWWQILPLGPTGYGDSPYQSFSAFAGNPWLISPEGLIREGLVSTGDVGSSAFAENRVDYGTVIHAKDALLRKAWGSFQFGAGRELKEPFEAFCQRQKSWLDDHALFMAIKEKLGGASWQHWPEPLRLRQPDALVTARRDLADAIEQQRFRQFLFFRQWAWLKNYANEKGLKLLGDAPIFVAIDSSDVWANPELFLLDEQRRPKVVAGVPPDYFAATGQLWGNPHYDWPRHQQTGYAWWVARLKATLAQVDAVRLDHFIGFYRTWHVPAGNATAEVGEWVLSPGRELFAVIRRELGGLPLLAEDLGLVTPEVEALREELGLPGMRILQFAFGGAVENRFLPHNYERNTVVYTGTHDNDTTVGWWETRSEQERDFVQRYIGRAVHEPSWDLIRLAWASVANYALAPLQDVLRLGSEARMNTPGAAAGNWCWRFRWEELTDDLLGRLRELTFLYGRERLP